MRRASLCLLLALAFTSAATRGALAQGVPVSPAPVTAPSAAAPPAPAADVNGAVFVAYPKNGAVVAFDHVIFEGSVRPGATLSVNGRPVPVGPDGLFSEWLPLTPGVNALTLVSVLNGAGTTLRFTVTSRVPARLGSVPARIVPGSATPDGAWVRYAGAAMRPEDRRVTVAFRGSPGGRAMFWAGKRGPFLMRESGAGRYEGGFTPGTADGTGVRVRFLLIAPDGSRAQATAQGTLSVQPGPRFAEVTAPDPGRGVNPSLAGWSPVGGMNLVYPRQGVRFPVLGEQGGYYLTRLPGLPLLEVTRGTAALLPPGTPDVRATAGTPSLTDEGSHAALRLPLGARVPYLLTQTPGGLTVTVYGAAGDADALNAVPLTDPLVRRATWTGGTGGTPLTGALDLTARQQWGYDAVYDGTDLVVRLRRPPPPPQDASLPLAGRVIVVDPGHGGTETGAGGALRVNEEDLVLDIAARVAAGLRAAGADVVTTRDTDVTVPLYDRPVLAETVDADLLLSVHANALPDGSDPRGRRGAGVYWTNPQALPLAQSILRAVTGNAALAALGQPGDDGTHLADLALTRPSAQVSVLVETAYMTDPGNLRSLMSAAGRQGYADGIVQGVLDFYRASWQAAP